MLPPRAEMCRGRVRSFFAVWSDSRKSARLAHDFATNIVRCCWHSASGRGQDQAVICATQSTWASSTTSSKNEARQQSSAKGLKPLPMGWRLLCCSLAGRARWCQQRLAAKRSPSSSGAGDGHHLLRASRWRDTLCPPGTRLASRLAPAKALPAAARFAVGTALTPLCESAHPLAPLRRRLVVVEGAQLQRRRSSGRHSWTNTRSTLLHPVAVNTSGSLSCCEFLFER